MFSGQQVASVVLPDDIKEKVKQTEAWIAEQRAELDLIEKQKKSVKDKLALIEQEITDGDKTIEFQVDEIAKNREKIEQLKSNLSLVAAENTALESLLAKLEGNKGVALAELEKLNQNREILKKQSQEEKVSLENQLVELRKELDVVSGSATEARKAQVQLNDLIGKQSDLSNQIADLENRKSTLENLVTTLGELALKIQSETLAKLTELEKAVVEAKEEMKLNKAELATVQEELTTTQAESEKIKADLKSEQERLEEQKNAFAIAVREAKSRYPNLRV